MAVFLKGLALGNYRGIGPSVQKMAPFREFNFFIGANNSGKSSILTFISNYLPINGGPPQLDAVERHRGGMQGELILALGQPASIFYEKAASSLRNGDIEYRKAVLKKFTSSLDEGGMVWLERQNNNQWVFHDKKNKERIASRLSPHEWIQIADGYFPHAGQATIEQWVSRIVAHILEMQDIELPSSQIIPAIRDIGPTAQGFTDYSGRGLIDRLAEIQNPPFDKREDALIFQRINQFLKTVTDEATAQIEIPHDRSNITVHMGDIVLPLTSLGTGIHEVIMIAAFCTLSQNEIVCIEEPELHLHPLLQRRLIAYLKSNTSNQYFIATHSAAFIDTPGAAIFHVQRSLQTTITETQLRKDKFAICADLGHRASDLLQSNAIIWVEGPSDRIYIKHWIRALGPELIEGIHYSIMFYGGRLLSHLSADDPTVAEFIDLKAMNRNMAIVMDSDRQSQTSRVNATKARIAFEMGKGSGVSWITKGREVENYVNPSVLHRSIKSRYATVYDCPVATGRYDHALYFKRLEPKRRRSKTPSTGDLIERDVDKVAIAKLVCEEVADLTVLDLRTRITELVNFVRQANAN